MNDLTYVGFFYAVKIFIIKRIFMKKLIIKEEQLKTIKMGYPIVEKFL